jgi:serine/threonine-protein kinase RsbW
VLGLSTLLHCRPLPWRAELSGIIGPLSRPEKNFSGLEDGLPDKETRKCEFDPETLILRLNITVPGDKKAVTPVVEKIMTIVRDMGCAKGKEHEIELAVQEAIANAVVHGCEGDPGQSVQVSVGCDEDRGMIIMVRDPGAGFDPDKIPSPLSGENLYASGGRGIYLINQLMDEVRFEKGGTEIWMRKG